MVSTKGLETKPTGTGKQLTQRKLNFICKLLGWKDTIKQLTKTERQT
jgi:hypothetical protein